MVILDHHCLASATSSKISRGMLQTAQLTNHNVDVFRMQQSTWRVGSRQQKGGKPEKGNNAMNIHTRQGLPLMVMATDGHGHCTDNMSVISFQMVHPIMNVMREDCSKRANQVHDVSRRACTVTTLVAV